MSEVLEVEDWARSDHENTLPKASAYRVRLWDGHGFDEKRQIVDATPTGAQILDAFERHPVNEYALLLLGKDGLSAVEPDEVIDISDRRAERFFAFRTDRLFYATLDERRFPWGTTRISAEMVRLIFKIPDRKQLLLAKTDEPDEVLESGDEIDLDAEGLERIFTRKGEWKLLVQGVLLTFDVPQITVRDALVNAGLDPDQGWTAILKFVGAPKESVQLNDTIDLSRKGIEKLWLRPDHVNNGEAHAPVNRAFELRVEDEAYLARRAESTETIIDGGKRWFILRAYVLPDGYRQEAVDIAVLMPPSYPAAQLDMFFCSPHLSLESGRPIPQTQSHETIAGVSYQRWSRHRSGPTAWNPAKDSLISHIALIEDAIDREVGAN